MAAAVAIYNNMPDLPRLARGIISIYCCSVCASLLFIIYVIFVAPLLLINKPLERRLQEVIQRLAVYVVLGVAAHFAHSEIVITLPEECGEEMELEVYKHLGKAYRFDRATERRLSCCNTFIDQRRDIVIANHQLYMDWLYIWSMMGPLSRAGSVKIILKRSLMKIPILGPVRSFILLHDDETKCIGDENVQLYLSAQKLGSGQDEVW